MAISCAVACRRASSAPWDAWLQDGMATARERLGDRAGRTLWDGAPPWRFALPAGACGPDAVVGVLLPSEDMVGRRFPITLAALVAPGAAPPAPGLVRGAGGRGAGRAGRPGRCRCAGGGDPASRCGAARGAGQTCANRRWPMPPPWHDAGAGSACLLPAAPWAEAIALGGLGTARVRPGRSARRFGRGGDRSGRRCRWPRPSHWAMSGAAAADAPGDPGTPSLPTRLTCSTSSAPRRRLGRSTGGELPVPAMRPLSRAFRRRSRAWRRPRHRTGWRRMARWPSCSGEAGLAGAQPGAVPEDPVAVLREARLRLRLPRTSRTDPLAALIAAGDTPLRAAPPPPACRTMRRSCAECHSA